MKQPYKAAVIGGGLQKAVTLNDFDNFLDFLVSGNGNGDVSPQELYKTVAWTFWSVNLRADSVAKTPYLVFPMDNEDDDPEAAVEWGIDLRQILWPIEAWLCLKAAAYVHKVQEGGLLEQLHVINANSMSVKTWDPYGNPLTFEQRKGKDRLIFSADDIIYFRTFDPKDEIREGISSGQVGSLPASLVQAVNRWGKSFFENSAIPAILLTSDGVVPPVERERIKSTWNKMLQGVRQAFGIAVVDHGLRPTVIGQAPKDLAMPEMEEAKRRQILAAHKVPFGLAEPSTNRAEQDALQVRLWTDCIIPEIETWIEPVLNASLFNPLGLRISFQYNEIEALQMRELEKSEGSAFLANIIKQAFEAGVVGWKDYQSWVGQLGKWSNMPPLDPTFQYEDPVTPPALEAFTGQQPSGDNGGDDDAADVDIEARIESRLPKSTGGEHPKASAPPRWGQHRIGRRDSLPNLGDGETKPPSAER